MPDYGRYFVSTVVPNGFIDKKGKDGKVKRFLNISVCMDLDLVQVMKWMDDNSTLESDFDFRLRFGQFYTYFQELHRYFNHAGLSLQFNDTYSNIVPLPNYFLGNSDRQKKKLNKLRSRIWDALFPPVTWNNAEKNYNVSTISEIKTFPHYQAFDGMNAKLTHLNGVKEKGDNLSSFYKSSNKTARVFREGAIKTDSKFHADIMALKRPGIYTELQKISKLTSSEISMESFSKIIDYKAQNIREFLGIYIDPEEFINTFNIINKNIVLKKLLGFVLDGHIALPPDIITQTDFSISLSRYSLGAYWNYPKTSISVTKANGKTAYLVPPRGINKSFFVKSMLDTTIGPVEVHAFDKQAQDQKLQSQAQKEDRGEAVCDGEKSDSFTRGLLLYHLRASEMIAPTDYTRSSYTGGKTNNGLIKPHEIDEATLLGEEMIAHGQRVAVIRTDTAAKKTYPLTSITARSAMVYLDGEEVYRNLFDEGCIHFDSVINTTEDGALKGTATDVLFEWSGQQLSLKSAFSASSKLSKLDKIHHNLVHPDASGINKSSVKTFGHLIVDFFPFRKIKYTDANPEPPVKLLYELPGNGNIKMPRLLFDNSYQFIIYNEYKNGWALPLHPDKNNPMQLSVSDICAKYLTEQTAFIPLENKKPVLLFNTKPITGNEVDPAAPDAPVATVPLSDRESLEHLVVRSKSGQGRDLQNAERHMLPEKISMEHAYWYGLLFDKMSPQETLRWKRKYNCAFHTEKDYNDYTSVKDKKNDINKNRRCTEGCIAYCESTRMNDYYTDGHIHPNYIADPSVKGVTVELYWDKACVDFPIKVKDKFITADIKFSGEPGIRPQSYKLKATGTEEEPEIIDHDFFSRLNICLKKGITAYLKITNILTKPGTSHTHSAWWSNKSGIFAQHSLHFNAKTDKHQAVIARNPPKLIALTHAVQEPLFTPKIMSLSSAPDKPEKLQYILIWLTGEFSQYRPGKNIVAVRKKINESDKLAINSSLAVFNLAAHFERLDAMDLKSFISEGIPTGGLELWVRKEEFTDDSDQFVLPFTSATGHLPSDPVTSFTSSDPLNRFGLEFKIEFTNDILEQLRDIKNISYIENPSDPFRSILSRLKIDWNIKTTKFEEREYYLKNISRYRGFFTDEKLLDDKTTTAAEKLEPYVLPKTKHVTENLQNETELRFKVMVLNNSKPAPAGIAFVVTTIRERRTYPHRKNTEVSQKGNLVTIYLKRGRNSSGKHERLGVVINSAGIEKINDAYKESIYNKTYEEQDLFSKAGRDIISDKFSGVNKFLRYQDIVIRNEEGEEILPKNRQVIAFYENTEYKPGYDPELGIYHFLPVFDIEKQLWKVEVELNIETATGKQLHNPFINFSLVNFQPFSINYNEGKVAGGMPDLHADCRLSLFENAVWCYLLPERKLSVYFDKPNLLFDGYGDVDMTLAYDYESLHHFNFGEAGSSKWKLRSDFILTIQGSNDGIVWRAVDSWVDKGQPETDSKLYAHHHSLLSQPGLDAKRGAVAMKLKFAKVETLTDCLNLHKFTDFRIRLIEVEWFSNETWTDLLARNNSLMRTDIVDNDEMRIRYIELIH